MRNFKLQIYYYRICINYLLQITNTLFSLDFIEFLFVIVNVICVVVRNVLLKVELIL